MRSGPYLIYWVCYDEEDERRIHGIHPISWLLKDEQSTLGRKPKGITVGYLWMKKSLHSDGGSPTGELNLLPHCH
jgi:hypothetical protein